MRMIGAIAMLAVFVFTASVAGAQEKADSSKVFPKGWREATAAKRVEIITRSVAELVRYLGETKMGFDDLHAKFPIKDDGTLIDLAPRLESDDKDLVVGIRVVGVWKDSPADRSGIAPGSWVLSVNGTPACGKSSFIIFARESISSGDEARNIANSSCMENSLRAANEGGGDSVVFLVDNNGKAETYRVGRAEIGKAVRDYIDQNASGWKLTWTANEEEMTKLLGGLSALNGDESKIDACYLKLVEIGRKISEPGREIDKFMRSQQKLLPTQMSTQE